MMKTERNYVWDRWGMESNLVAEFVAHTGAEPSTARNILQGCQIDISANVSIVEATKNRNPHVAYGISSSCRFNYTDIGADVNLTSSNIEVNYCMSYCAEGWDLPLALKSYTFLMGPVSVSHHAAPPLPPDPAPYRPWPPILNGGGGFSSSSSSITSVSRPTLQKSDAIDLSEGKKLARGISRATDNVNLVSKARSEFALEFRENALCNVNQYFIETPIYTFTLPDLTIYPEDFRYFLEKDLIEMSTLVSLEQAGRLNWWADSGACQRLWPLATTGDGNCLLHAASLGMWGFHDRLLTLRKALYAFLTSGDSQAALWRRWRWQQTQLNAQAGLVYSDTEWQREWDSIVNMASTAPRKNTASRRRSAALDSLGKHSEEYSENAIYESLEEVHVLALAHVLRRPIIVIADLVLKDVHGEALAPIPFGGIYLPLECPPAECHRSPLVLTYDAAHFSALVVMEKETYADKAPQPPAVIPLTDAEHELLPIQFSVDPGEQFVWGRDEHSPHIAQRLTLAPRDRLGLLKEYLDVVTVPLPNAALPSEDNGEITEPEGSSPLEEEEIERRLSEVDLDCDENLLSSSSDSGVYRSKAAKQLQSVAKQFGSIGKSMSKKLKKNLGSITKMTRNNSLKKKPQIANTGPVRQNTKLPGNSAVLHIQDHILCAVLHTERRHEYQEEMVHNYLQSARARFERDKEVKARQVEERKRKDEIRLQELAATEGPSLCINPGCSMYGTALTSYMCTSCYNKQKEQEQEIANNPANINSPVMSRAYDSNVRYGAGRSRFYAESDSSSHELASRIPLSRAGSNTDQTLYLSKSTFYNDSKVPGSPALSRLGTTIQSHNRTWSDDIVSNTQNVSPAHASCIAQGHVTVVAVNSTSGENQSEDQYDLGKMYGGFKLPVSAEAKPCRTNNCKFFGCAEKDFYCSKCHKENQLLLLGPGRSINIQEMRI